ncbi:Catabolite degradation [Mycena venus]|uniref:Catabolite degradation n=1 Tax=Mycena venus TaxID=2733690 RepID=A0A8H6WPY2_9AGAR|nr:Catabolite degradation [Mycena venus]
MDRTANPAILAAEGLLFLSASDVPIARQPTPRPLTVEEIKEYIQMYATVASNAAYKAGFDGFEVHAANGYFLDQFLHDASNIRSDEMSHWRGTRIKGLLRLSVTKTRENSALLVARLTLRHTYMPKRAVEFAGPSYFGGKNDELVLCAGKAGDIHIWDQESGTLLQYIPPAQQNGDLTCITWNRAADDPFMFATGSHDGGVRIWTQPEDTPDVGELEEGEGDGAEPVRSASPFDIERTDSPLMQAEFDALEVLRRQDSTAST